MTVTEVAILVCAFFVVATLYTTVGHAGASGYLATMAIVGIAPEVMRPTALALNILVAAITVYRFRRARYFSWTALWPFLLGSVPLAAFGGAMRLPPGTYYVVVGAVLLASAAALEQLDRDALQSALQHALAAASINIGRAGCDPASWDETIEFKNCHAVAKTVLQH